MPTLEQFQEFYAGKYWEDTAETLSLETRLQKERSRADGFKRLMIRPAKKSEVDLLDIGAGLGGVGIELAHFLDARPFSVEPDAKSRQYCRERGSVVFATLAEIPAGHRFDVIVLCHVLEHVADPAMFLRDIRERYLAAEGTLLLEVPNGITDKSIGFQHPYLFTPKALRTVLHLSGFFVTKVRPHGGGKSAMRFPYLFAQAEIGRNKWRRVPGLRVGRRLGQKWSRLVFENGLLRRFDRLLIRAGQSLRRIWLPI